MDRTRCDGLGNVLGGQLHTPCFTTPLISVQSLSNQGFPVQAYDVYPPSLAAAVKAGSNSSATPREAAKGVRVLALMVVNAIQVEDVLFGAGGVADGMTALPILY